MSFGMGKSNAKVDVQSMEGIHFDDVAGEGAKEKTPCIDSIDEIDAIGKKETGSSAGTTNGNRP